MLLLKTITFATCILCSTCAHNLRVSLGVEAVCIQNGDRCIESWKCCSGSCLGVMCVAMNDDGFAGYLTQVGVNDAIGEDLNLGSDKAVMEV